MDSMKSPETIELERKMHKKSYRFYWFCRVSWGYQQGQRLSALWRFWPAWRRFDRLMVEDQKHEL
jgi:hypothetical protein